jgi:branched-chain amino acid transport system ATP-binding protein
MTAPLLEVSQLGVAYSGVSAVDSVSLAIASGQIVSIVGANGAGKTSTLNAIMGVVRSSGTISFAGVSLWGKPVEARVRAGLGLVPEKRELFSTMSIERNLLVGAFCCRDARTRSHKLDEIYELFPRLRERRRQIAGTLSGGERQMLAMGRALMGNLRMLMLDEPSLGLAPLIVRDVFNRIDHLRSIGVAVLLVEQNARAALDIADYAYVMERGRVVLEGLAVDLKRDDRVIESYLGLAAVGSGTLSPARNANVSM